MWCCGNDRNTAPRPMQKGDPGDSAYEIWLQEGNRGTEADFLKSLKGDPGPQGLGIVSVQVFTEDA